MSIGKKYLKVEKKALDLLVRPLCMSVGCKFNGAGVCTICGRRRGRVC